MRALATTTPDPRTRLAGRHLFASVDMVLVLAATTLTVIGTVSVYAATKNHLVQSGKPGDLYLRRDLLNAAAALLLSAPLFLVNYKQLRAAIPFMYGGLVAALLVVLSPLGQRINGAHAWFVLGPVQLEPSEFSKLVVILFLAGLLSERHDRELTPSRRDVMWALAAGGIPTLLILAEPALGIAIVLAVVSVTLLALSGAPARLIVAMLMGAVLVGVLAGSLHLLKPYQQERFTAFADPRVAQNSSVGYQIRQSDIAIGSGGLLGRGFLNGSQTDGGFVPEQQTDFVFTVTAEEGGFLGGALLLGALLALLWRGVSIAQAAPDMFGQLIAGGTTMWLALQAFVNIGMTLGIMPVTGLPLPFVSYGGSSLLADFMAIALLLNIHRASGRSARRGNAGQVRGALRI